MCSERTAAASSPDRARTSSPQDLERRAHRSSGQSQRYPLSPHPPQGTHRGSLSITDAVRNASATRDVDTSQLILKQPSPTHTEAHHRCQLWSFLQPPSRHKALPCTPSVPALPRTSSHNQVSSLPHSASGGLWTTPGLVGLGARFLVWGWQGLGTGSRAW